jgi:hypothetical protein
MHHLSTTQQEAIMDTSLTSDEAATYTWYRLSLEHDPQATHGLSADTIGADENGYDIVSVIHLADRRHWNLHARPGHDKASTTYVSPDQLAETLLATNCDTTISVISGDLAWQLDVEILPKAYVGWSASSYTLT